MFPPLYDAHHSLYKEDLPFWLGLAKKQKGKVLELGCGTGRVLLPLALAGIPMVGLDNDLEMLDYLRARLPETFSPAPLLFAAEITNFHLEMDFSLIILPCNTWSTLSTAQRSQALGCIYEHLVPGGLFAVSMPSPDLLSSLPARSDPVIEEHYQHPLDGSPVQVSSGWRRGKYHFTVTWHYDHFLPDGNIRRITARVRHDLASAQAYQQELSAAGLELVAIYGDFERSPYTPDSLELILIARRPSSL
jgi:SAM-dependent methyltransferase